MKNARLSDFIHFQPVDPEKDITLGWNRFFPTIFFLNRFAMDQLAAIKERRVPSPGGELQPFFRQLQRYKFIYTGDKDPAQEDFSGMIAESQELLKKRGEDFFRLKNAYAGLTVFNDECNLACSYCVNRYQAKPAAVGIKAARKWEVTRDCIARYITRKLEKEKDSPANSVRILFNGGEILLEWKLIKRLLQWLKATYPDVTFEFHMNTNLTLMT
jgi:sulfatase maturation enzyme AslB (radical SAM superfamily)